MWSDATAAEREIKKFKDIFSKSIYADLLNKIDNANNVLKTLIEQSHHREETRKRRTTSKRPLLILKIARKHANSLYNAIIRGKCWKCPCKDQHCVHFQLNTEPLGRFDASGSHPELPGFRMAFSMKTAGESTRSLWHWQEIETEPVIIGPLVPVCESASVTHTSNAVCKPKVRFSIATSTLEALSWSKAQDLPSPPISDMCSTLCAVKLNTQQRELIGFISDEADANHGHNMYLVRNLTRDLETQSLEELLACSSNSIRLHTKGGFMFNRRDRLCLAANLACSVLQFHGSWLKAHWASRDILFAKSEGGNKALLDHPYLSWHVLSSPEDSNTSTQLHRTTTALIRNEILFPLGLVLLELSLCQTISALHAPEDDDPVEAVAKLKTASRHLQDVYCESGTRYGDVVDKCLFWSGTRDAKLDDEEFQRNVFDTIVMPLLDDVRAFEGRLGTI